MTIHTTGGGVVLTLAREELPRKAPLTGEALLPLVCRALGRVGRPLPPAGGDRRVPRPGGGAGDGDAPAGGDRGVGGAPASEGGVPASAGPARWDGRRLEPATWGRGPEPPLVRTL